MSRFSCSLGDLNVDGQRFDTWIRYVDGYEGDDLSYLNPSGVIPTNAVIKKGIKRRCAFRERKRFDVTSFTDVTLDPLSTEIDVADDDEGVVKEGLEETEG